MQFPRSVSSEDARRSAAAPLAPPLGPLSASHTSSTPDASSRAPSSGTASASRVPFPPAAPPPPSPPPPPPPSSGRHASSQTSQRASPPPPPPAPPCASRRAKTAPETVTDPAPAARAPPAAQRRMVPSALLARPRPRLSEEWFQAPSSRAPPAAPCSSTNCFTISRSPPRPPRAEGWRGATVREGRRDAGVQRRMVPSALLARGRLEPFFGDIAWNLLPHDDEPRAVHVPPHEAPNGSTGVPGSRGRRGSRQHPRARGAARAGSHEREDRRAPEALGFRV